MKKLICILLFATSSLLWGSIPKSESKSDASFLYQPEEGAVTRFQMKTFSSIVLPLKEIMPLQRVEEEPLFGMKKRTFSANQFEKVAITNNYLDALLELIHSHDSSKGFSNHKKEKLSQETKELLKTFEEDPNYEKKILGTLHHLKEENPSLFTEIRDDFMSFYEDIASRGHFVSQVTRYSRNPEKTTQDMILRGAVPASPNEVYTLHPSIPVTMKSSSEKPLTSEESLIRRDDHHVYTFAGKVKIILANLQAVSPETFWEPADESLITDNSAPFVTAVEKNEEGSSLTPFIHMHPTKNKETMDIAKGLEPLNTEDPHQISVGLKDSQAIPDPNIQALGQLQHTGIEVKTGSLGLVMQKLREKGLSFIERPSLNSGYYENIQKNLYMMFLPALLKEAKPHDDLDPILGLLSSYGFYVKTVPTEKDKKQPLLSKIEEMRENLSQERQVELDLLLEKLLSLIDYFHSYKGVMHESNKTALATTIASLLQRVSLKAEPRPDHIKEFETIFSEILPRIREALNAGYFMEFVLKWDPEQRKMTGGLLSQIFTLPLASKATGRFTQWIELIERACFRETTLEKGGDRGCSQFGGGSFSLSGTVNNFMQLIRGVTKAVEQTKRRPQLPLVPLSRLKEDPEFFLDQLTGPTSKNSPRALLSLPKGSVLTNSERRLVRFIRSLLHISKAESHEERSLEAMPG